MDFLLLLRRALFISLLVGLGAAITVYFFNDWFHRELLPSLGLTAPLGDALGSLLIVMVAFLGQRLVSVAFYRDWLFGMGKMQEDSVGRAETFVVAAELAGSGRKFVPLITTWSPPSGLPETGLREVTVIRLVGSTQ